MQGLRLETGAGGRASSVSSARQTVRKTRIAALGPFVVDAVYRRDCIEAMREIPDRAIDVAIADPPYNLSKGGRWA
ncbi:MAG TPA: hypothetical protein VGX76_24385, partial [Pirellulales bacterium]|nr:hypothetical protein [Pirellulales bacterium]